MPAAFPKTRVGSSRPCASGRLCRRGRRRPINTPGSRGCAYKTASGRGNWPNRDPLGERGFVPICAGLNRLQSFYEGLKSASSLRDLTSRILSLIQPAESSDGLNLYAFVANNPNGGIDSLGLQDYSSGQSYSYGNPVSSTLPGLGGTWPSNPYAPGAGNYSNGAFYQPDSSPCPCGQHWGWSQQRASDFQNTVNFGYLGSGGEAIMGLVPKLWPVGVYGAATFLASIAVGFGCMPN